MLSSHRRGAGGRRSRNTARSAAALAATCSTPQTAGQCAKTAYTRSTTGSPTTTQRPHSEPQTITTRPLDRRPESKRPKSTNELENSHDLRRMRRRQGAGKLPCMRRTRHRPRRPHHAAKTRTVGPQRTMSRLRPRAHSRRRTRARPGNEHVHQLPETTSGQAGRQTRTTPTPRSRRRGAANAGPTHGAQVDHEQKLQMAHNQAHG